MADKFSLKWNDFQTNVSRTFSLLRREEEFFDVSLVSADQKTVSAHKLVLSACSPYFKHILTNNKHSHPLLCLDGVTSIELENVLDYIYRGEVQISQVQLDRFLEVAQRLELDGLTQEKSDGGGEQSSIVIEKPSNTSNFVEEELVGEKTPKQEKIENSPAPVQERKPRKSTTYFAKAEHFSNSEEIDKKLNEYVVREADGNFSCGFCGKSGVKTKQNLVYHLETHIEGLSYPCQDCDKSYKNRSTLSGHKSIHRV